MSENPDITTSQPDELTILSYLNVLRRYAGMIIALFIASQIAACIVTFLTKPEYEASATILVLGQDKTSYGALLGRFGGLIDLIGLGATPTKDILESRRLARIAAKKVDVNSYLKKPGKKPLNEEQSAGYLMRSSKTDILDSGVITITAVAPGGKLAAEIVSAYVAALEEFFRERSLSNATMNRIFVEKRLSETMRKLREAEETRKNFLEVHDIASGPSADLSAESDLYPKLASELTLSMVELERIEKRRGTMAETGMTEDGGEAMSPALYNDPAVVTLRGLLVQKEIALAQAEQRFQPDNVNIKTIKEEIEILKARLAGEILTINHILTLSDDVEYIALSAKVEALRSLISAYPAVSTGYMRIAREIKFQEELVTMLSQEYERAKIAEKQDKNVVEILDEALPPETPFRPKLKLNLIVAGALSLSAGVFLAFFLNFLRGTSGRQPA